MLLNKNPIAYAGKDEAHKEKEHNIGRAKICFATLQQMQAKNLAGKSGDNYKSVEHKAALLGLRLMRFGKVKKVNRGKDNADDDGPHIVCKIKHRVENYPPNPDCRQCTVKIFHDCSPILKNKIARKAYHKTSEKSRLRGAGCAYQEGWDEIYECIAEYFINKITLMWAVYNRKRWQELRDKYVDDGKLA